MKRTLLLAVIILALCLAGCSGDSEEADGLTKAIYINDVQLMIPGNYNEIGGGISDEDWGFFVMKSWGLGDEDTDGPFLMATASEIDYGNEGWTLAQFLEAATEDTEMSTYSEPNSTDGTLPDGTPYLRVSYDQIYTRDDDTVHCLMYLFIHNGYEYEFTAHGDRYDDVNWLDDSIEGIVFQET